MKLLVWKGKHGDTVFDVSTEEKKAEALKRVFAAMSDPNEWDFYYDLRTGEGAPEQFTTCHNCNGTGKVEDKYYRQNRLRYDTQKHYYEKALTGDVKAIEQLLWERRHGEYEWVEYTETA